MFERNSRAEEVFSAAWEQVRAGHSIESVVAQYPDLAADLEPMLRLAQAVRDTPAPALPPDAMVRIQARARQAAQTRPPAVTVAPRESAERMAGGALPPRRTPWFAPFRPSLRGGLAMLLVLLMVGVGLVAASVIMPPPRPVPTLPPTASLASYSGVIKVISDTQWIIDDEQIIIEPGVTQIHGQPRIGVLAECIGE